MGSDASSVAWGLFLDNKVSSPSPENASSSCHCLSAVMFERLRSGTGRYFSKGMFTGSASCLQTTVKILKGRGNTLIFTSDTIRYGHPPLHLPSFSLRLVRHMEKKPQREILVLLHHLKNSSLFCVCMETAGLPKLSCHLPCVTSALHCREQKEQLCYTEFKELFFSGCRGTKRSVHSRLCLHSSLAAANEKTQFICQTNLLWFWALFKSSH